MVTHMGALANVIIEWASGSLWLRDNDKKIICGCVFVTAEPTKRLDRF